MPADGSCTEEGPEQEPQLLLKACVHVPPVLQIEENMKALELLPKLTPDVLGRIEAITTQKAPEA